MGRVRAYVGIGANLGDRWATTGSAVRALGRLPSTRLVGVSRLWATRPVGVTDQPEFHNAVVALDVRRGPNPTTGAIDLLVALKWIELEFGRRPRERWGPREIDLDLLVFGRHAIDVARPSEGSSLDPDKAPRALVVPHPEARDRLFVLAPLADIAPGLVPPGWGETVRRAYRRCMADEGPESAQPVGRWESVAGSWSEVLGRWDTVTGSWADVGGPAGQAPR